MLQETEASLRLVGLLREGILDIVWLNPEPEKHWKMTPSTTMTLELMENRMHSLTLKGIEDAMRYLSR